MEINPKFQINNLLTHKFENQGEDAICVLEAMEIHTNTCYAGTQVFYECRQIHVIKKFEHEYSRKGPFVWAVAHAYGKTPQDIGWKRYREDELIDAPQWAIDIILKK